MTSTIVAENREIGTPEVTAAEPPRPSGRFRDPAAVALLATAVSLAGGSRPSLWYDEAATISASQRPLADLWSMLANVDAVHGLYYFLMHGWFAVAPATEFWSRVPSGLAVGAAAAGTVVLARRFSSRAAAICCGVMLAILPRITWAGIESRSYALSAVAAVWVMVLLIAAVRGNRPRLWAIYALCQLLSILLNSFLVFLVPVHAILLGLLGASRSAIRWWSAMTAVVAAGAVPFIVFTHTQVLQVGWISPLGAKTWGEVAINQYFDDSIPAAITAAVLIVTALVLMWRRPGRLPQPDARRLLVVAGVWVAIPTAAMLTYSAIFEPVYYPRYLTYTSPATAIALGVAITTIARRPVTVAATVVVFALAALPNYVTNQRGPYAKEGMDFSQIADVLDANAAPGDCLLLDNTTSWAPGPIRPLTAARPHTYDRLYDPGRAATAVERDQLWDAYWSIWDIVGDLPDCRVIWLVSERDPTQPDRERGPDLLPGPRLTRAPAFLVPARSGFRLVERWQFSFAQVAKSVR